MGHSHRRREKSRQAFEMWLMDNELREVAGRPPSSMVGKNIQLRPRGKKPAQAQPAPVLIPAAKAV